MTERKQDEKQETRKKRPNKQPHLGIEKKRKGGTEEEEKKTRKKNNKQYHTNQHTHLIVCDADKLEVMLSLSV